MPSSGTSTVQATAAASAPPATHSARARARLMSGTAGAVIVSMCGLLIRFAVQGCAADHEALRGRGNRTSSGWRRLNCATSSSELLPTQYAGCLRSYDGAGPLPVFERAADLVGQDGLAAHRLRHTHKVALRAEADPI